nr:protein LIKE COV 1-like [Ipomoea batatas]
MNVNCDFNGFPFCYSKQNYAGDEELYCVYVPTNHLYIGDVFLINANDVIRPNLSVREGIGMRHSYFTIFQICFTEDEIELLVSVQVYYLVDFGTKLFLLANFFHVADSASSLIRYKYRTCLIRIDLCNKCQCTIREVGAVWKSS